MGVDQHRPIGIAQGLGTDYPLIAPSEDIAHLLADFFLSYDDPSDYDLNADECTVPFHIVWIYGLGTDGNSLPEGGVTHAVDLLIHDATNLVVFDSREALVFQTYVWSDTLTVYEWRGETAICRIVAYTSHEHTVPCLITPTSAVLAERTIERQPKRVKSFTVGVTQLTDMVVLQSGYSLSISQQTTGQLIESMLTGETSRRLRNTLLVDGEAAGGDGAYPGCSATLEEDKKIYRINGIAPNDAGDFRLSATDCYRLEIPCVVATEEPRTVEPAAAALKLNNNCVACCSCDDFVQVMGKITTIYGQWKQLGQSAGYLRDRYNNARKRWNKQRVQRAKPQQGLYLETYCNGLIMLGLSISIPGDSRSLVRLLQCYEGYTTFTIRGSILDPTLLPAIPEPGVYEYPGYTLGHVYEEQRITDRRGHLHKYYPAQGGFRIMLDYPVTVHPPDENEPFAYCTLGPVYWPSIDFQHAARFMCMLKACNMTWRNNTAEWIQVTAHTVLTAGGVEGFEWTNNLEVPTIPDVSTGIMGLQRGCSSKNLEPPGCLCQFPITIW